MRSEEFVKALTEAGWTNTGDAQNTQIYELWRKLFPCIAELSDEIDDLKMDISQIWGDS